MQSQEQALRIAGCGLKHKTQKKEKEKLRFTILSLMANTCRTKGTNNASRWLLPTMSTVFGKYCPVRVPLLQESPSNSLIPLLALTLGSLPPTNSSKKEKIFLSLYTNKRQKANRSRSNAHTRSFLRQAKQIDTGWSSRLGLRVC